MAETYDELIGRYQHVYTQSGALFQTECAMAEHAITLSFSSYFSLPKKMDERSATLAAFFYRNCVYLSATYQMIRSGMLDPAGNNMRTIFETIIWQYSYLCEDDIYDNFMQITALEEQKLSLIQSRKWSNTKERDLENLRRKYSFQKMMKRLYSKEVFEKFFFSQYWMLCQKSHSSIFGVNHNTPNMEGTTTMEKRPQELKDNLIALLYLCAENMVCFLNCFQDNLDQGRIDSILAATNEINRSIPPALTLSPDTKDLRFKVRFREI